MAKKKITRIIAMAIATLTITSGMAFASTNVGEQLLTWAKNKVTTAISTITVENKELKNKLETDSNLSKKENKAGVTEYGKLVGDEKASDLKGYGDEYINELEKTVAQLEREIPATFDEFVTKITDETTNSLNNKSGEIIKKIESSQGGFGGELWSVQNSAKQVIDRKLRVSSADIQKELKAVIEETKQEIETLIQNEDAAAREEVKANVDVAYNNALQKVKDSLYEWETKAKNYLDQVADTYYATQTGAIDKVVADELSKLTN